MLGLVCKAFEFSNIQVFLLLTSFRGRREYESYAALLLLTINIHKTFVISAAGKVWSKSMFCPKTEAHMSSSVSVEVCQLLLNPGNYKLPRNKRREVCVKIPLSRISWEEGRQSQNM